MKLKWAARVLATLDAHLLQTDPEIAALRAAGVGEQRLAALYPFDDAQYVAGIERLIAAPGMPQRLREILQLVNVPYSLGSHLPQRHGDELWQYMHRFDEQGRVGPHARIGHYSPTLYAAAVRYALVSEVETMLQLPTLLHVLGDYPFADQQWYPLSRIEFESGLRKFKPHLIAYAALLENAHGSA